MAPRVHVDTPAGRLVTSRIELLSGSVAAAAGATITGTCGDHELLLRPCVHPDSRYRDDVQGFWGFVVVQDLLDAIRNGTLAIELFADGRHVDTIRLRVAPAARHLARCYPVSRREYPVSPTPRDGCATPITLVFPGLGGVGGASLNQLLRMKAHRASWQVPVYFEANVPSLWSAMRRRAPAPYRWIDGHGCYAAADDLGQPFARITFLREPLRRLVSVYRYTALVHPREFPFPSLDAFVASGAARRYTQAAGLLRCAGIDDAELSDGELAATARTHLEREYALAGITELYEESIFLLCQLGGYASIGMWSRVLAAPRTFNSETLSLRTRRRLEAIAAVDQDLYDAAKRRLVARLARAGVEDDLRRYKSDAATRAELPDVYKLRECLRWRAVLERPARARHEVHA